MLDRDVKILTIVVFFTALLLYGLQLGRIEALVWDEQYHVLAAKFFHSGNLQGYLNPNNPPLGKEIIAASIQLLGDNFSAYRLPSVLAGAGVAALLALLGARLAKNLAGGILAGGLWLTSTLAYIHARLGMLDMMATFCLVAGLAAFLPIVTDSAPAEGASKLAARKLPLLYLACFLAGWGGAIKVLCYLLFPLFFLGLVLIRKKWPLKNSLPHLCYAGLIFTAMALIFSYALLGVSPLEIPGQLKEMALIQSTLHRDHASLSAWPEWFIFQGSHWYTSRILASGGRLSVWCANNPVLWIPGTISLFFLLAWGRKKPADAVLAAAVLIQLLFWSLFKKQTILYYGLPLEPIFCLGIPVVLSELSQRLAKGRMFYLTWTAVLLAASTGYFLKNWEALRGVAL